MVSVELDDQLVNAIFAASDAEDMSAAVERGIWLYLVLENPEEMLADEPIDEEEVSVS